MYFGASLLPPKFHRSLSLSLVSLMKALLIELCLYRPKLDKETLERGQPHFYSRHDRMSSKLCDHITGN